MLAILSRGYIRKVCILNTKQRETVTVTTQQLTVASQVAHGATPSDPAQCIILRISINHNNAVHIRHVHVGPGHDLIKDLNSRNDCAAFMFTGSIFQTRAPWYWNERRPYVVVFWGAVLICICRWCHKECLLWQRVQTNSLVSFPLNFE